MKIYFATLIILLIALLLAVFIIQGKTKQHQKANGMKQMLKAHNSKNGKFLYHLHRFFMDFPLSKKFYGKIKRRIELITPADEFTIAKNTAKTMILSISAAITCFVLLLLLGTLDLFYFLLCILVIYVVFTHMLNTLVEKQENKLLKQFANFLSEIRHYYHESGCVEEAVYETIDHVPYEMGLHANKIYDILNSSDVELESEKYNRIAPNRFFMTFLATCTTILKYGDKIVEGEKQSVFLKNINYLKQEVNVELLKQKENDYLFSGLVFISILPVFVLKLIEKWAINNIPDMANYYSGTGGIISMVLIFLSTIVSYTLISKLKDGRADNSKEHTLLTKISKIPIIQSLLTKEINRNYSKSLRTNDMLKSVGEKIGPNILLLKRCLFSIVSIIFCYIILNTMTITNKNNILTDYKDTFKSSLVMNDSYLKDMKEACKDYTLKYKNNANKDYDELVGEIINTSSVTNKTYAKTIATEVLNRAEQYSNFYFRWYYLLICVATGFIGFNIPYLLLKYRTYILQMGMEDETNQFHTIILLLMHIDRMSIDTILEWIERFAFSFKTSISECIMNLEQGESRALEEMKNTESFGPFKRLVDNLMTVDKVGVAAAFDEIDTEREYYKDKRQQDNKILTNNKSILGKCLAFTPIVISLAVYLIIPFVMMALNEFNNFTNIIK